MRTIIQEQLDPLPGFYPSGGKSSGQVIFKIEKKEPDKKRSKEKVLGAGTEITKKR